MQCSSNNKAITVLKCFGDAIEKFGVVPTRIRTEHGGENVKVWEFMQGQSSDINPKPVTAGSSVHNQRVERFNREVNCNIREKYASVDSAIEQFSLHYVYIPRVNRSLKILQAAHNNLTLYPLDLTKPMTILSPKLGSFE